MGTKRTIVSMGDIYAGFGEADGAMIVIVPLLGNSFQVEKLLLLHIAYRRDMTAAEKKEVLGYRYNDIRNLINEYNLPWSDACLDALSMGALLGEPVEYIADQPSKTLDHSRDNRKALSSELQTLFNSAEDRILLQTPYLVFSKAAQASFRFTPPAGADVVRGQ